MGNKVSMPRQLIGIRCLNEVLAEEGADLFGNDGND